MTNIKLSYVLRNTKLTECTPIIDNYIYYVKKPVKEKVYNPTGNDYYEIFSFEFLIITNNGEKQAIILRCDSVDLHWYVFKRWRKKHVLSNALRTGIISEIWPENKKITCCYEWDDNRYEKYKMTSHLAEIAGLEMNDKPPMY